VHLLSNSVVTVDTSHNYLQKFMSAFNVYNVSDIIINQEHADLTYHCNEYIAAQELMLIHPALT